FVAQIAAAEQRSPYLKAVFPFGTLDDMYDAVWHRGVLNSGFFSSWMSLVGIMSRVPDSSWAQQRSERPRLEKDDVRPLRGGAFWPAWQAAALTHNATCG
ncbi:MAG: hypothetical protein JO057_30400, partial [Chloroflexi bacterium]|nr:hypothetical protein [Chloroflexota bacterium]